MKLLFFIIAFSVVSLDLGHAAFNRFFKRRATTRPRKTFKPTTIPATASVTQSEPTRRRSFKKNQIPDEVMEMLRNASSETDFRKMMGMKEVAKKDEISSQFARQLEQSANGGIPDIEMGWGIGGCTPRLEVVSLQEKYLNIVFPTCIMLKRCGGCCHIRQKCVPVKTETYSVNAYFYSYVPIIAMDSGGRKRRSDPVPIYKAPLPEDVVAHTKCGCECILSQADCNERQYWNEGGCECSCKDDYSKDELACKYPFEFDSDTCQCRCVLPHHDDCDHGKVWSHEKCDCVCKDNPCQAPEVQNEKTCQCKSP